MVDWLRSIKPEVKFLNVDLEVVSARDLQPLVEAWENETSNLYCGEFTDGTHLANFETDVEREAEEEEEKEPTRSKSDGGLADALILKFCSLIRGLEGEAKELWETASRKTFDLGYESGLVPYSLTSALDIKTLQEIVRVSASINITLYCVIDEGEYRVSHSHEVQSRESDR